MGKSILAVVAGYLVMAILVTAALFGLYAAMGPDGAFNAGSYDISLAWILCSFGVSALAAVAGGALTAWLAPDRRAAIWLCGVIVLLGGLEFLYRLTADMPDPGPRPAGVTGLEAMQSAVQPLWIAVANPLIGIAGVLVGSRLVRRG